jgi:hypothetical protein
MFNWIAAGAAGVLGIAVAADELERRRALPAPPRTDRMGALPGPGFAASWVEAEPKPGCSAWLVPVEASDLEQRQAEIARSAGRDPFAEGHLLAPGTYAVTVVERGRVVPLHETLWVAVPGTYALTRLREPDGKLRVAWSVTRADRPAEWLRLDPTTATWTPQGVLDPALGFPLASPRYGRATLPVAEEVPTKVKRTVAARIVPDSTVRPRDGAQMVDVVTRRSQACPVMVVWTQADCALCHALMPVLRAAARTAGTRWVLVTGEGLRLEKGLPAEHLDEASPWVTDRYPTVRRFERGEFISEAPDTVVDYWIQSGDARDLARWAQHDVSVADLGPPPAPT